MLTIAGSNVHLGDSLYITRAGGFGLVTHVGETSATVRVQLPAGPRDFTVSQGGLISGVRGAYWHAPIVLDLPRGAQAKLAQVQAVVDTLRQVL
jgi:hypothetical protein